MRTAGPSPREFYSTPEEKNKLNWFSFELADCLFEALGRADRKLARHLQSLPAVSGFAVAVAKHLRATIHGRKSMQLDRTDFPRDLIVQHFPNLPHQHHERVIDTLAAAWDAHIDHCLDCSQACIHDGLSPCPYFDEPPDRDGAGCRRRGTQPARDR